MSFISWPMGTLYKKSEKKNLKKIHAGYVGKFYRNLAANVDNFLGSDYYGGIENDYNIPSGNVQKYILAMSDFAKWMQTDINHYVTKDRINNENFSQKLDPFSKNIIRKQNLIKNAPRAPGKFTPANNLFGSQTQTLTREKEETKDKVLEEIDEKIHEIPDLPKLELGNGLINVLGAEAKDILEDKFVNSKKLEDDALENIKEGYGFE